MRFDDLTKTKILKVFKKISTIIFDSIENQALGRVNFFK